MKLIVLFLVVFSYKVQSQDIFKNEFEQNIAFRIATLEWVDPHPFAVLPFFGCEDASSFLNDIINDSLTLDNDGDGNIDDSLVTQFYTDQPDYITNRNLGASIWNSDCPLPLHSSACLPEAGAIEEQITTTFNQVGECLSVIPGTESSGGYTPAINTVSFPCYVSDPKDINFILLNGSEFPLSAYQQSEQYFVSDLTSDTGMVRGFLSQEDAALINVTINFNGSIYTYNLAESLPGHPENCETVDSGLDDMDVGPDNKTLGWWLYFNSTSEIVEFELQ